LQPIEWKPQIKKEQLETSSEFGTTSLSENNFLITGDESINYRIFGANGKKPFFQFTSHVLLSVADSIRPIEAADTGT